MTPTAVAGMAVLLAGLGLLVWVRSRTLLAYFQQEEYDDARFLRALPRVGLFDIRATVAAVALWAVAGLAGWWGALPFLLGAVFALIGWREMRWRFKKPLAMTERARRMLLLARGLAVVPVALVLWHPLWAIAALQALPLALVGANRLLAPLQRRINDAYVAEARDRLERLQPVTIGITGSFGKTTVKHILAELLEAAGPTFWSRGSINTVLGLTRHIRERLQPAHRFFVAEMGAYGIGSIRRLCDFARPRFGIVTAVGQAHVERFGSLEATAQAKSELAAHVVAHGEKVVVTDRVAALPPFAALRAQAPEKFIVVGEGPDCDLRILDARADGDDWRVRLALNHLPDRAPLELVLPLLGAHNVMNLALAVAMVSVVAPEILDKLPRLTPGIAQIPHRLQRKDAGHGPLVLDDAYNANEDGFLNALEVLRDLADRRRGRAILITPGVAELGSDHDIVHGRLGRAAGDHCDVILAIGAERMAAFAGAARGRRAEVHEVATLAEARAALAGLHPGAADVVLYENDLPDLLEERRLL